MLWQLPQARSLNSGPRPSADSSTALKLSSASANRSGSVPGSGEPTAVTAWLVAATASGSASACAPQPAIAAVASELVATVHRYRFIADPPRTGMRFLQHKPARPSCLLGTPGRLRVLLATNGGNKNLRSSATLKF